MNSVRLGEIVAALGGELRGDPAHEIARIAPLETAGGDAITFVAQARLRPLLEASAPGATVVAPSLVAAAPNARHLVVTDDPYLYFARLTQWWAKRLRPAPAAGVHPSAFIAPDAQVAPSAAIGPMVVVESGAVIGDRVQ
ncbi:MAG: UDP-3-O-(3-hydroxymyristoyl)glucosamine N-acyltransferase, partial [Caulobacter sp.]|nr:UDP-3-O-(3-hydroxymyristoyl)glucosamine N-acyltransferase [Vitreoscilla sp.]